MKKGDTTRAGKIYCSETSSFWNIVPQQYPRQCKVPTNRNIEIGWTVGWKCMYNPEFSFFFLYPRCPVAARTRKYVCDFPSCSSACFLDIFPILPFDTARVLGISCVLRCTGKIWYFHVILYCQYPGLWFFGILSATITLRAAVKWWEEDTLRSREMVNTRDDRGGGERVRILPPRLAKWYKVPWNILSSLTAPLET